MEICLSDIDSYEYIDVETVYDISVEGNYNYFLNCGYPVLVHNSGKTWSILQLIFLIAVKSEKKLVISVVSRALPHLKLGAMRDFDNILLDNGIIPDKIKNKTDNIYKVGNSIIEFFGVDQLDKVHGPARDILFLNEANFIKYDVFTSLYIRTNKAVFIDYNPSQRFWVHDDLIPNEKHILIKSTYRENTQCPASIYEKLEAKRLQYDKMKAGQIKYSKAFDNWCKVYLFGEIGVIEGAIFENWRYGEPNEVEQAFALYPSGFGLDYGFNPDPDAMAKVAFDRRGKRIYLQECIYKINNGTEDLIHQIKQHANKNDLIIAESANPRTNHDLSKHFNIKKVRKTKTVADWLRILQDYEIIISENSYNLELELQNYIWNDKRAGQPIDEFNHLCDGFRYFVMSMLQPRPTMKQVN